MGAALIAVLRTPVSRPHQAPSSPCGATANVISDFYRYPSSCHTSLVALFVSLHIVVTALPAVHLSYFQNNTLAIPDDPEPAGRGRKWVLTLFFWVR